MTFGQLKQKEGKISGLLALDRYFTAGASSLLKRFLLLGLPVLMVAILSYQWETFFPVRVLYGLVFLDLAALLFVFMIDCFYYSHYFGGIHTVISEWNVPVRGSVLPFEVHEIVSKTRSHDLTLGFLNSKAGRDIMARLNIPLEIVAEYVNGNRLVVYADPVEFTEPVDLCSYASAVFDADKTLYNFLSEHGVGKNDFLGAVTWVSNLYEKQKESYRWWGKDSLGKIRGVGKDWTKTDSAVLQRFGHFVEPKDEELVFRKEINKVEHVLSHEEGKKMLLVADEYRKLEAILAGLTQRITDGTVLPPLQHKKIWMLDTVKLDEITQAEGRFQIYLGEIFVDAIESGNMIVVIKNFPFLVFAAKKREMKLSDIIAPYLNTNLIDIIGLSTLEAHSELIKPDHELTSHFEHVHVEADSKKIILEALEHKAFEVERKTGIFFTYQSLDTLADIAIKTKGEHMAEYRALELFLEIIPKLLKNKTKTVTVSDIIAVAR